MAEEKSKQEPIENAHRHCYIKVGQHNWSELAECGTPGISFHYTAAHMQCTVCGGRYIDYYSKHRGTW